MKKKGVILILFAILLSINIKAQNEIDSLEKLLNQDIEDSIRIQTLSTLAWDLKYKDANKAIGFAEEALERSIEIGHKKEQARAHQYISNISRLLGQYDKAIQHAEASILVATEIGDTIRISNSNNSLGLTYKTKGENTKAIPYLKMASTYAEYAKAFDFVTTIQNNIGHVYLAMSQYDSARIYYFEAINRALPRKDSVNIQRSFNTIAVSYMEQGDFSSAFNYYFKSLEINEKLNNQIDLEINWNNLGNLFHSIEDYEKSIFYHEKTLVSRVERDDKKRTANSYNNIGMCYLELGDFKKASQVFKQSIDIYEAIDTKVGLGGSLNNLGLTLQAQGLQAEAEPYFQQALKEHKITGSKKGIASSLAHLSSVAFHQKKYRKSINFATQSLKIAKDIRSLAVEKNCYKWLAKSSETLKLYDESTAYYKAYNEVSESLMDENKVKIIAQSIARYDLDKKETIIDSQSQEIISLKEESVYEKFKGNLFLSLVIILVLLILLVIFQFRQKTKYFKSKNELKLSLVQMNNKMVSRELEMKENELRKYVQTANEKNEILDLLQKKISLTQNDQISISSETYQELNQTIQSKLNKEKDWEQFQKYFNQIHINFLNDFASKYENLTSHELRLAALIRLNMPNKEIAKLLNIEISSAKKARNRLRKKLAIDSTEDLTAFIIRFSS